MLNPACEAVDGQALPLVTVVMPVRNEAAFIARSLGAVLRQDYPPDKLEVIIADGMSEDGTRDIIGRVAAQYRTVPVTIIDNPGRIVPSGLNLAIARARGSVLIRVDGHCEIMPQYVRRCVAHLMEHEVDGVGGPIETISPLPLGKVIAAAMSCPFGVGGSAFRTGPARPLLVDTIPFPAYRREAIERAGPFDEELVRNQDDEYNYRLREAGGKLLLAPDIRSKYYSRRSLPALWKQYFQYGLWKVRVMQKHPAQMRPRHFIPALFVAAVTGGGGLAVFIPVMRTGWLVMLTAYLLSNIAASVLAARRAGWQCLPLLPVVFASLHISYGVGFLAGLVRFAGRWRGPRTSEIEWGHIRGIRTGQDKKCGRREVPPTSA